MKLHIPDDIIRRAEATPDDLRLVIAIHLYAENRIDHGDACRLADVPASALNLELVRLGLSVQEYSGARLGGRPA